VEKPIEQSVLRLFVEIGLWLTGVGSPAGDGKPSGLELKRWMKKMSWRAARREVFQPSNGLRFIRV